LYDPLRRLPEIPTIRDMISLPAAIRRGLARKLSRYRPSRYPARHALRGRRDTAIPRRARRRSARARRPKLRKRPAADEQGRSRAAGWIHRSVGDGNADEVDERQREADRNPGEPDGRTRVRAARITTRNMNVITTSVMSAAVSE
jgi:hypothetical protein